MAPPLKKARRPIGSMLDAFVQESQLPNNIDGNSDSDTELSDNNMRNSDANISSSDDSDPEQTENDVDDANGRLVRRGPAKMGFEWGTGKVLQLELNAANQVVGGNAGFFSSQIGILAKDGNKLPLTYTDWRAVPIAQKNLVWEEVKENTNLKDNYKRNCLKKLGKLWKDWKNRLKAKYYTPHRHDKSYVLSKCPERVEADQWPLLVNHWSSNIARTLSKTNRNSRKQVKAPPPRLGRKDMANAIEEFRQEYGKEPSQLDLFVHTRKQKSGGKPIDKNTEEKIALLKELKEKLPDNLRDDIDANNEIFKEVIGKHAPGCLRINDVAAKNVTFTSREEFDQAVLEKSNNIVASIRKGFEDEISKFKDDYSSQMEILQARLLTLEDRNVHVSGSSNSRRIQAFGNGSSPDGLLNMNLENLREENETNQLELREETNNSNESIPNIGLDTTSIQEQGRSATRKNKRKIK